MCWSLLFSNTSAFSSIHCALCFPQYSSASAHVLPRFHYSSGVWFCLRDLNVALPEAPALNWNHSRVPVSSFCLNYARFLLGGWRAIHPISEPIWLKNDLAKTSSFKENSAWCTVRPPKALCWHGFKVARHAVGTEQGHPAVFEALASPTPPGTTRYGSAANSFIFTEQHCCVFSVIGSICSFHCFLPWRLRFPSITSPPSQVLSPEQIHLCEICWLTSYAKCCKLATSMLFKLNKIK